MIRRGKHRKRRANPLSKEAQARQAERAKQRRVNEAKLTRLLSGEKEEQRKELAVLASWYPPETMIQAKSAYNTVTRYADPVIQAFYNHVLISRRLHDPDFDPKAEYDAFIASYGGRFGPPAPPKKVNKSRKGIGGPKEKLLTQKLREVLKGAEEVGEELNYSTVLDRVWGKLYPGKDKSKLPSKWKLFEKALKERLRRIAPHLLPKNARKKRKS